MGGIIAVSKSIIPACDVKDLDALRNLVRATADINGIGAYKVGAILAIRFSLGKVVDVVRENSYLPIIYDHQKGMTDIPDLSTDFLGAVQDSGVDAFIGFPLSGPETQKAWIEECKRINLKVIIGGKMTHARFEEYISPETSMKIYALAAQLGVNNFVVPGNNKDAVAEIYAALKPIVQEMSFYAPGFVAQHGVVTETAKAAGDSFHAIVGRGIYAAPDMKKAAEELAAPLLRGD